MRPEPKRRDPWTLKRLAILLVSLVAGWFLGWGVFQVGSDDHPVGILGFLFLFAMAIFVHEFGHVIGAATVQFQVQSFTVGPISLRREGDGFHFRRSHITLGGLVMIVPVGLHELAKRMLVVVAAGPISSYLFSLVGFILGRTLGEPLRSEWLNPFALVSATLGVLSIIPMRRFYLSDGAQIWDLLRSPERAERQCALLTVLGVAKTGMRPKEWDPALIEKALAVTDGSGADVSAHAIAYEAAMDSRDFDTAEKHLEAAINLLPKCPPKMKSAMALTAAFFYSMVRQDPVLAREWLDQCKPKHILERYSMLMVDAAVLLSEGKRADAARKAEQSIALLPKAQFPGFAAAGKDWLEIILQKARVTQSEAQASVVGV